MNNKQYSFLLDTFSGIKRPRLVSLRNTMILRCYFFLKTLLPIKIFTTFWRLPMTRPYQEVSRAK